jgi:hypothetical protein
MEEKKLNTKTYRMLLIMNQLQKKDADQIVDLFSIGGYSISKSRAMNLISGVDDMSSLELNCFVQGLFTIYKSNN